MSFARKVISSSTKASPAALPPESKAPAATAANGNKVTSNSTALVPDTTNLKGASPSFALGNAAPSGLPRPPLFPALGNAPSSKQPPPKRNSIKPRSLSSTGSSHTNSPSSQPSDALTEKAPTGNTRKFPKQNLGSNLLSLLSGSKHTAQTQNNSFVRGISPRENNSNTPSPFLFPLQNQGPTLLLCPS